MNNQGRRSILAAQHHSPQFLFGYRRTMAQLLKKVARTAAFDAEGGRDGLS